MGFSVSGATVILFLGIFISFGVAYTAADNGFERVQEAYEDDAADELVRQNTGLAVTTADRAGSAGRWYVNVTVENTGTTTLSVPDTDVLVDGNYTTRTEMTLRTVDGNAETDLWLPGETLHVNVSVPYDPADSRVKVVTGPGVSAAAEVSV